MWNKAEKAKTGAKAHPERLRSECIKAKTDENLMKTSKSMEIQLRALSLGKPVGVGRARRRNWA